MANFLIKKKQTKKITIKFKLFVSCKLLIISLLTSMQAYVAIAANGMQNYDDNQTLLTTNQATLANENNLDTNLIKNEVIPKIKNRLNNIKNIYDAVVLNNTSLPTEVNVSLQIALLDTMTIVDNSPSNIPFIRLNDLQQQLINLIKQQDGSKVFVVTSLGFNKTTITDKYFNHKETIIPHSIALYARIKNNKLDILIFEPLKSSSIDHSGIIMKEVISTLIQEAIKNEASSEISFDIYEIPLSVELCGTDCMTHAYGICQEINADIVTINSICDYIDTNSSKAEIHKHIFNNIPVTFFKTIYQLDFLEHIVEGNNYVRANEVALLKAHLEPYYKNNFNIFSISIYEMGLYKQDKNKYSDNFKFYYPESSNSYNYLGCFTNINALIPYIQLELAKYAINCLSDENLITKLTPELLLELDQATADIDTINYNGLYEALEFTTKVKQQYTEYTNEYYFYKVKSCIDLLIKRCNLNIKKQRLDDIKDEISEVQVFTEIAGLQDHQHIGNVNFNFSDYKQQILATDLNKLLIKSLEMLNAKINTNNFYFSEIDKMQLALEIHQVRNSMNNLLNYIKYNIQHLFINNNIDIQTSYFFLKTQYSFVIDLCFFHIIDNEIENIIKFLNMNNDNFFQEILKEQAINAHKNLMDQTTQEQIDINSILIYAS